MTIKPWRLRRFSFQHSLLPFISLFCICCLLVVSCSRQTQPTSQESSRISIGTTLKLRTLDPADAYEAISGNLLYNLGDRLYTYETGTTQLKPQLATALPKISADNLTYTIPLRPGVTFHDGTPFNAEAMAFSLRRFLENGGAPSALLTSTVEKVTATGEYELTIKLKKPFAAFTPLLAFSGLCAVSPKVYEVGAGKFKPDIFVGTGPYKLTKYGTDFLLLDAFEQYWGEKPKNPGIAMQRFSSSATLFNSFRTGAIDIAYLSLDPVQISSLKEQAASQAWHLITGDSKTINYMVLNLKIPPLDNVLVRQALAAMIDRSLISDRAVLGQADSIYSLLPKTFDSYKPVFEQAYGDGNAVKAKALLTQAGYSNNHPAKVEIWYASNSTKRSLVASTIKAVAERELGGAMQIELNSVEATTAYKNLDKGVYPTFLLDWYGDFLDPDNYIQPFLECDRGSATAGCSQGASQGQGSFYYSDRANQLIAEQRKELNIPKRKALLAEIQDILAQDVPFIPLWQDKDYAFAQKQVTGVHLEPSNGFPFWTIHKQAAVSSFPQETSQRRMGKLVRAENQD